MDKHVNRIYIYKDGQTRQTYIYIYICTRMDKHVNRVCVCVCVRACVRACVRVCVCVYKDGQTRQPYMHICTRKDKHINRVYKRKKEEGRGEKKVNSAYNYKKGSTGKRTKYSLYFTKVVESLLIIIYTLTFSLYIYIFFFYTNTLTICI